MSDDLKNPCKEIDLGVHDEAEFMARKIREALGVNTIGVSTSALAEEMAHKQFNDEREHIRSLYKGIIKDKCVELGIDPETLRFDWNTMKWGEK